MIGQTISHYRIVEKLGEGGMGVVYKADDTKLHRAVALKFLAPDRTRDEEAKKRFMREAQSASALDHPNIAVVHEIDETDDGQSFICMTYYPGQTLKESIEKGPLPLDQVNDFALQIISGLQRAHEAGIIHCDIKPANILITERGEVKIVDFGIAKLASQTVATRSGTTGGTAAYMSPEQAQGQKIDLRSDLFSLGIVLYEMITGQRPFGGDYEPALMYSIVSVDPVRPSSIRPEIPKGVETFILTLLQKDPAKRYQSAAEARSALMQFVGITDSTRRLTTRFQFLTIRNLTLPVVIAVVALLFFVTPIRDTVERWLGIGGGSVPKHIVVLPFTNVGNDSTNRAFCDGFMETLTSKLTQMQSAQESFWVVASSEVRQRKVLGVGEAQRAFGVTFAITGSIQREGNDVRVILNLVDAKTSHQLKSIVLDNQVATLSKLQDEAVMKSAEMLEIKLQPRVTNVLTAGSTVDSKAYDFYLQARGYLQRYEKLENINIAIGLFERALIFDSMYALAYAGLGEAYWRKYEATKDLQWIDPATKYSQKALGLNNKLPQVHITLGLINKGRGEYQEAVKEFQQTFALDSVNADAYRELAGTFEALEDFPRAERTYREAINLRPSYWAGYTNLGAFYYRRKRYNEALEQFKKVVDLTPDNARGYSVLGAVHSALQHPAEAQAMIEHSLAIEPTYVGYSNLATLYFRAGNYADLARTYEKALALNDQDYRVWGNLASAYYWSGKRDSATNRFQRAIKMAEGQRTVNPRDPTVLSQLADYYSMIGKKPDAIILIKQALIFGPGDLEVIKRAADIYETVGQREQVLAMIEQGLKKGIPPKEFGSRLALKALQGDVRYQQLIDRYGKKP